MFESAGKPVRGASAYRTVDGRFTILGEARGSGWELGDDGIRSRVKPKASRRWAIGVRSVGTPEAKADRRLLTEASIPDIYRCDEEKEDPYIFPTRTAALEALAVIAYSETLTADCSGS